MQSELRVKSHGRKVIEFYLTFPFESRTLLTEAIDVDLYLFSPKSLQITSERYSVDQFFEDLIYYTRFKTPSIPLSLLTRDECSESPLIRIKKALRNTSLPPKEQRSLLCLELKMLYSVVSRQLEEENESLLELVHNNTPTEALLLHLERLSEECRRLVEGLREQIETIEAGDVDEKVKQCALLSLEGIIRLFEEQIPKLYYTAGGEDIRKKLLKPMILFLKDQQAIGEIYKIASLTKQTGVEEREQYLHRRQQLKKWAQKVLYMSINETTSLKKITQILFGIAAGVAMLFAILAAALLYYTEIGTLYWIMITVAAYIFKDRIKDGLRAFFLRFIPKFVADRIHKIVDPWKGKRYGKIRERLKFLSYKTVPKTILSLRNRGKEPISQILDQENILCYSKSIALDHKKLASSHTRFSGISEILRLNIERWLSKMDKSEEELLFFREEEGQRVPTKRVYHFNFVVKVTRREGKKEISSNISRWRAALSSDGIVRVSQIASTQTAL